MSNDVIDLALKLEADEKSAKKTQQTVDKIIANLKKLQKTTKDPSQLSAINKQIKLYKEQGSAIVRSNEELAQREDIQKKQNALLEKEIKLRQKGNDVAKTSVQLADDRVSATRKNVAVAGDVESNLRAVGGAAGAFGAGAGVQQGVGAVAELPALVEALPILKDSLAGLPATVNAAAQAIGVGNLAAGGALVGALFLATEAFKSARDAAREFAEEQAEQVQRVLEGNEIRRMTTEELLALQEEASLATQNLTGDIKSLAEAEGLLIDDVAKAKEGVVGFFSEAAAETSGIKELNDNLKTSQSNLAAVNEELVKRNDLDSGAVDRSREIGDLRRAENDALDRTNEGNRDRLAELKREAAILQEQIAELKRSGDTSQRAKDELKGLEGQLSRIGKESVVVANTVGKASDELESANTKIAASSNKIASIQNQIAQETIKVANAENKARNEARKKQADAIQKFQADSFKKRGQILKDFNRSVIEAELKSSQTRRKQAANQDFKALFEQETVDAEEEQARLRARDDKLSDLQENIKEERKKLLTETKVKIKAGSNQLANLNKQLQAEIRAKNEAAKAVVALEIEKGKTQINIQKQLGEQFVALWRQVAGSTGGSTTNNNQSLTLNGQPAASGGFLKSTIQDVVLNTLDKMGVS